MFLINKKSYENEKFYVLLFSYLLVVVMLYSYSYLLCSIVYAKYKVFSNAF